MRCRKCDAAVPPQEGPGRRRTMCEKCSPKDTRARRLTPVTSLPAAIQQSAPPGGLAGATLTALEPIGRAECPEGALALMLAGQLDSGGHTGSQAAALSKEFRAALDAATKGVTGAASTLDQLRARRAARRGA